MSIMLSKRDVRDIDFALSSATGGEGHVYFGYSGRGMYGETCIGVELRDLSDLFALGVELARSNGHLAADLADDVMTDDLGLGIIAYFPSHDTDASSAIAVV